MGFTIDTPIEETSLTAYQKKALATGKIKTFADMLVAPLSDVARRCKLSPQDAKVIYDRLLKECPMTKMINLKELKQPLDQQFSTGDDVLDRALGGGIRTGMVWELAGESSAGKTQLALQTSLTVQLPSSLGGISGSACYLTTSSKLPTTRLKQIAATHPILSQNVHVGLQNVHTLSISTVLILENILTNVLPNFIQQKATSSHPIKFVVIDALTELFNSGVKPSKATMIARAKDLHLIASALHNAASKYNIAILVLNEVRDRFEHSPLPTSGSSTSDSMGDKRYHELSQWFGTSDSVPGENTKEASLGLVWANHLNVRIMLTKTGRRRYLSDKELPSNKAKRAKLDDSASSQQRQSPENDYVDEQQTTLIRRLSVVFSSVAPKISLDYIVTKAGVSVLADDALLEELKAPSYYTFVNDEAETPESASTVAPTLPVLGAVAAAAAVPSAPQPRPAPVAAPGAIPPAPQPRPAPVAAPGTIHPAPQPLSAPAAAVKPAPSASRSSQSGANPKATEEEGDEDEWDKYWKKDDELFDYDAVELNLSQNR